MAIKVNGTTVVNNERKGTFEVSNPGQFTTAERDALSPVSGDMIFNTDEASLQIYDGTDWVAAGGVVKEGYIEQPTILSPQNNAGIPGTPGVYAETDAVASLDGQGPSAGKGAVWDTLYTGGTNTSYAEYYNTRVQKDADGNLITAQGCAYQNQQNYYFGYSGYTYDGVTYYGSLADNNQDLRGGQPQSWMTLDDTNTYAYFITWTGSNTYKWYRYDLQNPNEPPVIHPIANTTGNSFFFLVDDLAVFRQTNSQTEAYVYKFGTGSPTGTIQENEYSYIWTFPANELFGGGSTDSYFTRSSPTNFIVYSNRKLYIYDKSRASEENGGSRFTLAATMSEEINYGSHGCVAYDAVNDRYIWCTQDGSALRTHCINTDGTGYNQIQGPPGSSSGSKPGYNYHSYCSISCDDTYVYMSNYQADLAGQPNYYGDGYGLLRCPLSNLDQWEAVPYPAFNTSSDGTNGEATWFIGSGAGDTQVIWNGGTDSYTPPNYVQGVSQSIGYFAGQGYFQSFGAYKYTEEGNNYTTSRRIHAFTSSNIATLEGNKDLENFKAGILWNAQGGTIAVSGSMVKDADPATNKIYYQTTGTDDIQVGQTLKSSDIISNPSAPTDQTLRASAFKATVPEINGTIAKWEYSTNPDFSGAQIDTKAITPGDQTLAVSEMSNITIQEGIDSYVRVTYEGEWNDGEPITSAASQAVKYRPGDPRTPQMRATGREWDTIFNHGWMFYTDDGQQYGNGSLTKNAYMELRYTQGSLFNSESFSTTSNPPYRGWHKAMYGVDTSVPGSSAGFEFEFMDAKDMIIVFTGWLAHNGAGSCNTYISKYVSQAPSTSDTINNPEGYSQSDCVGTIGSSLSLNPSGAGTTNFGGSGANELKIAFSIKVNGYVKVNFSPSTGSGAPTSSYAFYQGWKFIDAVTGEDHTPTYWDPDSLLS